MASMGQIKLWQQDFCIRYPGTKRQWQNANTRNPNTKNAPPKTQKSVALPTLAFCSWHYDRIPCNTLVIECPIDNLFVMYCQVW